AAWATSAPPTSKSVKQPERHNEPVRQNGASSEGRWEDAAYKNSARALQDRHLASVSKRGGTWSAELTDAGRHYLEHGTYPLVQPTAASRRPAARPPRPVQIAAARTTVTPATRTEPERREPPQRPAATATRPASKSERRTLGEQLIDDLIAAGGRLVVHRDGGPGTPNWPSRVNSAKRSGKLPAGKDIKSGWAAGGYEIRLEDIPAWRLAVPDPVPVPERLTRPHSVVATLRDGKRTLDLGKPVLPRALRLIQAIVAEAERRGHTIRVVNQRTDRHGYEHAESEDHFIVTAQGHPCGVRITQLKERTDHVASAKELADAARNSWIRIPRFDYLLGNRLGIAVSGGFVHRQSQWSDTVTEPLEGKLPQILQEIDLRGAAAEAKRHADQEAARERRRQWEAAVHQAGQDYAEAYRIRALEQQELSWRRAARFSEYLRAAQQRVQAAEHAEQREAAQSWLSWIQGYVDRLDPLNGELRMPAIPEPRPSDLEPFLNGWSPYGP
ncbi:hypothetical protein ABH940_007242, partial [Streptacidiphilus sp. BW17]|uniref:hypothetical protein n=1 Tax=Streptacidiphilus sp. BW17 TaxID=3156274 RepID=UPI003517FEA4